MSRGDRQRPRRVARPSQHSSNFGVEYQSLGKRLAGFKTQPSVSIAGSVRPLFTGGCAKCSPHSLTSLVDPHTKLLSLRNILEYGAWWGDVRSVARTASGLYAIMAEWLLLKVARFLLPEGLIVSPGQIEVLQHVSKAGLPFLYITSHRSILDNLVVGLALRWAGLPAPVVLNPYLLRGRGTGWWWAAVGVVREGVAVGQLAGGRSVQVFEDQDLEEVCSAGIEDVMIVPMTASYSLPCGRGTLWSWLTGRGQARLDIDQPFSLREHLKNATGAGDRSEKLVRHIAYNRLKLARITSTQLLAFITHTSYTKEMTIDIIARHMDEVRDVLGHRGVDFAFSGDSVDVVRKAIDLLGGELEEGSVVKLNIDSSHLVKMSTAVSVHYLTEALVATAVQSLVKDHLPGYAPSQRHNHTSLAVSMEQILERAGLLVKLLRPVLAPPCASLDQQMTDGLARLERLDVVGRLQDQYSLHAKDKWVTHMGRQIEIDDGSEDEEDRFKDVLISVGVSASGRVWLDWLLSLTKPVIVTYHYTLSHLHKVRRDGSSRVHQFVADVKEEIRLRKAKGYDLGMECEVDEVVKNCVDMLVSASVIDVVEDGGEKWLNLTEEFDNELKLDQVVHLIHMFL